MSAERSNAAQRLVTLGQPDPGPTVPSGREILVRLLELTPEPDRETDAERLLVEFESILARRAEVLAQIVPPLQLDDVDRPLLGELERRQSLWQAVLAEALRIVGEQRCGASQLRAYATSI